MALLNAFVASYIPQEFRHGRDFIGDRGWVDLTNLFLRKVERRGLFLLGRRKEVGVEVENNFWITLPSDCRKPIDVYYPPLAHYSETELRYNLQVVNGKIKLFVPFDKDGDPDTFTLSAGSTTQITADDDDAAAKEWNNSLLVLTDGTALGDQILIGNNEASAAGTVDLPFIHTHWRTTSDSTAGYLTSTYLMLTYRSTYTAISAATDEIPVDDMYEDILADFLIYQSMQLTDKRRKIARDEFENDLNEMENEIFTPSMAEARPVARDMPAFQNLQALDSAEPDYIGDDS